MKKYKMDSAAWKRQQETKANQRESTHVIHPRSLARSVAKGINRKFERRENDMTNWKNVVAKLPRTGSKRKNRRTA